MIKTMAKIFLFFLLTLFFGKSAAPPPPPPPPKDLGNACQNIWNAAATGNNLKVPQELKVDTTGLNPVFKLEPAGETKTKSDVFKKFKDLLTGPSDATRDAFLDEITIKQPYGPAAKALDYLKAQGIFPPATDMVTFESTLKDVWSLTYGPITAPGKGWRHVFIGEKSPPGQTWYSGFHNWYQFYLEQDKSKISAVSLGATVPPYTYNTEPSFIRLAFTWDGKTKTQPSSFFVGTSPAFDFAIFSVCYIALYHPSGGAGTAGKYCTCKIHKSTLKIAAIRKTLPGTTGICTVYPESAQADPVCKNIVPITRTDCGWVGIDHHSCAERGCCFDSQPHGGNIYWCFYPENHKCHGILPENREDCGYIGISREDCEKKVLLGIGCCFDDNFGGVPHCFKGRF